MKRLFYFVPLVLLSGLIAAFAAGLQRDPSILPSQLLDKPLPTFSRPGLAPGQPGVATATFRGRPALLNVWASWCGACKVEHPVLVQLSQAGVPIYGLAWKDAPEDSARVLAQDGNPYRAVGEDADGRTAVDLGVTGAPETFVVDAAGRVRFKQVGPITPDVWRDKIGPLMAKLERGA